MGQLKSSIGINQTYNVNIDKHSELAALKLAAKV